MEITQLIPSKQRNSENITLRTDSITTFKYLLLLCIFSHLWTTILMLFPWATLCSAPLTFSYPTNLIPCSLVECRAHICVPVHTDTHRHAHTVTRLFLQCWQRLKLSFSIGVHCTQIAVNRSNVTIKYTKCVYESLVFKLISGCTTCSCIYQSLMYLGFNCFSLWHNKCQNVMLKHSFCIINHSIFLKGKDNYNKITVQNCLEFTSYLWQIIEKIIA